MDEIFHYCEWVGVGGIDNAIIKSAPSKSVPFPSYDLLVFEIHYGYISGKQSSVTQ